MAKSGEIKGLKKLLKDLNSFGDEGRKMIAQTTEGIAREIERDAKTYAPVDLGTLRQGIKAFEVSPMTYKVFANANGNAPYSAYMEFGTGGLVEVPSELKEVAAMFKGKGIRRVDIRPRPFLYPAFIKGRTQYIKDLEGDLKHLTGKI